MGVQIDLGGKAIYIYVDARPLISLMYDFSETARYRHEGFWFQEERVGMIVERSRKLPTLEYCLLYSRAGVEFIIPTRFTSTNL